MVDVDVDVQDSFIGLEQFQDCEYAVVDVAETGGLLSFGVVEAS